MDRYYAPILIPLSQDLPEVIHRGMVEVDEGRVTWVGPESEAPPTNGEGGTEHRLEGILMPGLINTHAHTPMVLLRGLGEGLPVDEWLQVLWKEEAKLTPELVHTAMLAGGAELLRNGITTTTEMYFYPDQIAEAATQLGLRSMITPPLLQEMTLPGLETWEQQWEALLRFREKWEDAELIMSGVGPHAAYSVPEEALRTIARFGQETGTLIHIHLAEQEWEEGPIRERAGVPAPQYLADLGLFAGRVLAAHGVWLSDNDIALLAEHQVSVAHCPCSNTKHASGVIRLPELFAAGVNVTLATDGPASHHRLDLFEEIRTAIRLARVTKMDANFLTPSQALAMVTTNAARALGRNDLGSLSPGSWADMINLDISQPAFHPHLAEHDPISRLVWSGSPDTIENVWVGGKLVVADGNLTTADQSELAHRMTDQAKGMLRR